MSEVLARIRVVLDPAVRVERVVTDSREDEVDPVGPRAADESPAPVKSPLNRLIRPDAPSPADVGLHVSWRRRIGPWLTAHFPGLQLLVTTHSPYICQSADPGGLIRLPGPREGGVPPRAGAFEFRPCPPPRRGRS
ncbi:hypothetical protein GCM10010389_56740 [Streptomyces echinoruber]|uniref:ATPase AAA-type core domain-containing protein n=1 Tax=Streptomyces echinoruber TaxID=68898 RepID=A0A918VL19_9ACTN|nr:hypothetical protein GCM10010389_56740 [Streptomyces echinoruber]